MNPQKPQQKTDAIVVLTGGKDRIETAMELFADGLSPELFITGVNPEVRREEVLARAKRKLPDCCITLGYKATTTTENGTETKDWIKDKDLKTIRLVTSNFHMPRAFLELHHALPGIKITLHPIMQPDITPQDQYFWIVSISEYNKTIFRIFNIMSGTSP